MINKKSVLLVDDHPLVLNSLAQMVDSSSQFRVIGKLTSGAEAIRLVESQQVDLAILDLNMNEMSGLELARKIKALKPTIKILIFSMHEDPETMRQAKAAGANGYLPKSCDPLEVIKALDTISMGEAYYPLDLGPGVSSEGNDLTPRELEVLKYLAKGLSSKEISNELNISPRTVEVHRGHLLKKFKAKNVVELISSAREKKWI